MIKTKYLLIINAFLCSICLFANTKENCTTDNIYSFSKDKTEQPSYIKNSSRDALKNTIKNYYKISKKNQSETSEDPKQNSNQYAQEKNYFEESNNEIDELESEEPVADPVVIIIDESFREDVFSHALSETPLLALRQVRTAFKRNKNFSFLYYDGLASAAQTKLISLINELSYSYEENLETIETLRKYVQRLDYLKRNHYPFTKCNMLFADLIEYLQYFYEVTGKLAPEDQRLYRNASAEEREITKTKYGINSVKRTQKLKRGLKVGVFFFTNADLGLNFFNRTWFFLPMAPLWFSVSNENYFDRWNDGPFGAANHDRLHALLRQHAPRGASLNSSDFEVSIHRPLMDSMEQIECEKLRMTAELVFFFLDHELNILRKCRSLNELYLAVWEKIRRDKFRNFIVERVLTYAYPEQFKTLVEDEDFAKNFKVIRDFVSDQIRAVDGGFQLALAPVISRTEIKTIKDAKPFIKDKYSFIFFKGFDKIN